jgi:hypothetical protein
MASKFGTEEGIAVLSRTSKTSTTSTNAIKGGGGEVDDGGARYRDGGGDAARGNDGSTNGVSISSLCNNMLVDVQVDI